MCITTFKFCIPLLKMRQERNIAILEYSKALLGFASQMWLFWGMPSFSVLTLKEIVSYLTAWCNVSHINYL